MITTVLQKQLIRAAFYMAAQKNWNPIKPIGKAFSFCDSRCFTMGYGKITGGKLIFWFEDSIGSSHMIIEGINNGNTTDKTDK